MSDLKVLRACVRITSCLALAAFAFVLFSFFPFSLLPHGPQVPLSNTISKSLTPRPSPPTSRVRRIQRCNHKPHPIFRFDMHCATHAPALAGTSPFREHRLSDGAATPNNMLTLSPVSRRDQVMQHTLLFAMLVAVKHCSVKGVRLRLRFSGAPMTSIRRPQISERARKLA